jgi:hypothetical protein
MKGDRQSWRDGERYGDWVVTGVEGSANSEDFPIGQSGSLSRDDLLVNGLGVESLRLDKVFEGQEVLGIG